MSKSFRDIAQVMDPVTLSHSLREVTQRHRWGDGNPPAQPSLRSLTRRHEDLATAKHRFLWYNTFLLEGWVLSLCADGPLRVLLAAAGMAERDVIKALDLSPVDVLEKVGAPKSSVLKMFDISANDIAGWFPGVHKAACSALGWVPGLGSALCAASDALDEMLKQLSIGEIMSKANVGLDVVLDKLQEFGFDLMAVLRLTCEPVLGFLQGTLGIEIPTEIKFAPRPELAPRAHEIGTLVGQGYDIVALCEVFSHDRRMQVLENAQTSARSIQFAEGPDDQKAAADGGLFTMAFDALSIVHQEWMMFDGEARGDYFRDADAWANKGVLLSVINVGVGQLEIYSTHLINGGDLITLPAWLPVLGLLFPPLSSAERLALQAKQVDQLIDFYKTHHKPENVALVVGDFNMSAQNKDTYEALTSRMASINLRDVWPYYRQPAADPAQPRGDTHSSVEEKGQSSSSLWKICQPNDAFYCDDVAQTAATTSRIDYVFAENPMEQHTFMLDLTRIRRRSFLRQHTPIEELYLSDHVGLELNLITSPRVHAAA